MGLIDWLQGKLLGDTSIEVSAATIESYINSEKFSELVMEEFLIHSAINLMANCISKCEFITYQKKKEFMGEEYYKWNYEPNLNQNSSQFIQELITKLFYDNECLAVESKGQLIIAENFTQQEFALSENIFTNVYRKGFTFNRSFRMSEVLYFKLNNDNIRKLLTGLCTGYNELLQDAVDKYQKAGGEKGTLNIDAQAMGKRYGEKSFEEVYEDLMNNRFSKFFKSRNAVLPLFNGFTYTKQGAEQSKKSTSEVKDITDISDEILIKVAQAFNIPVSLLKGDVADVEKITQNFLTFCIDPVTEMITEEIMRKRYGKAQLQLGNYIRVDTTCVMHIDIFNIAEKFDKLIASGGYCIDELRKKCGDAELGTEESQKHYITKNYSAITGTGGEENAKVDEPNQV